MSATEMLAVVHHKERRALRALIKVYGDDTTDVLNGLHAMAARIALATGVSPENFAAGMKHHWDFLANAINEDFPEKRN